MAFPWVAPGTGTDQELLDIYRAALAQIGSTGQAYGHDGRTLTRADLDEVRKTIEWLEGRIAGAENGPAKNLAKLVRKA